MYGIAPLYVRMTSKSKSAQMTGLNLVEIFIVRLVKDLHEPY